MRRRRAKRTELRGDDVVFPVGRDRVSQRVVVRLTNKGRSPKLASLFYPSLSEAPSKQDRFSQTHRRPFLLRKLGHHRPILPIASSLPTRPTTLPTPNLRLRHDVGKHTIASLRARTRRLAGEVGREDGSDEGGRGRGRFRVGGRSG